MTDLTEQWKKGELINGKKYYITFFDSEPFEATFRYYKAMIPYWKFEANGKQYCDENGYDCVKVLAPVPSYDRFCRLSHLENDFIKAHERINELKKENQQLKELLKRVVNATDFRHEIKIASVIDYRAWYNIAKEINQVLGEK